MTVMYWSVDTVDDCVWCVWVDELMCWLVDDCLGVLMCKLMCWWDLSWCVDIMLIPMCWYYVDTDVLIWLKRCVDIFHDLMISEDIPAQSEEMYKSSAREYCTVWGFWFSSVLLESILKSEKSLVNLAIGMTRGVKCLHDENVGVYRGSNVNALLRSSMFSWLFLLRIDDLTFEMSSVRIHRRGAVRTEKTCLTV
jgi:hypothetical protein